MKRQYLVVSENGGTFLQFGDGACYSEGIHNLLKYPVTDRLTEAVRQLELADGQLYRPKIVRVKVTFEDVDPQEIEDEMDEQAIQTLQKMSEKTAENLVRYILKVNDHEDL